MVFLENEFGYCTNVHAGTTLEAAKCNLLKFASKVQKRIAPNKALPVGLWLAEEAALSLTEEGRAAEFGEWLANNHFKPYTLNGFPQSDFHQPVVKHRVYSPTWLDDSRRQHTERLADILCTLLTSDESQTQPTGSISTLPLGWPHQQWNPDDFALAAKNLSRVAEHLERIQQTRQCEIVLAIEPEPGCVLNTAREIVEFFERYLLAGADAATVRRHITVCHDICHSGVMFEPQQAALELYRRAGIRVGKVQVSSAVHVPWDQCGSDSERATAMLAQLKTFDEPKYLHQATRADDDGQLLELCEDLPVALENWIGGGTTLPSNPWRVHFHVPIYVDTFDHLKTTQPDIAEAVSYLEQHRHESVAERDWFTGHYEVETYAWTVLPKELAAESLSDGIIREMECFREILDPIRQCHRPEAI